MTNRGNINHINERTGSRNMIRQLVNVIQTSRSGISHNSSVKIYGEGAITYKVVQNYMAPKLNVAYMENDDVEEHLRAIESNKVINSDMVYSNGKVKFMVHKSSYQYGGIKSAINCIYSLAKVQMPERMKRELSTFIVVMDKTVIAEKKMLDIKNSEENP